MIEFTEEDRKYLRGLIAGDEAINVAMENSYSEDEDGVEINMGDALNAVAAFVLAKLTERPAVSDPEIKRYDCETERVGRDWSSYEVAVMEEWPTGDWVKYEDHCRKLAERPAGDAGLRESLRELYKVLEFPAQIEDVDIPESWPSVGCTNPDHGRSPQQRGETADKWRCPDCGSEWWSTDSDDPSSAQAVYHVRAFILAALADSTEGAS